MLDNDRGRLAITRPAQEIGLYDGDKNLLEWGFVGNKRREEDYCVFPVVLGDILAKWLREIHT